MYYKCMAHSIKNQTTTCNSLNEGVLNKMIEKINTKFRNIDDINNFHNDIKKIHKTIVCANKVYECTKKFFTLIDPKRFGDFLGRSYIKSQNPKCRARAEFRNEFKRIHNIFVTNRTIVAENNFYINDDNEYFNLRDTYRKRIDTLINSPLFRDYKAKYQLQIGSSSELQKTIRSLSKNNYTRKQSIENKNLILSSQESQLSNASDKNSYTDNTYYIILLFNTLFLEILKDTTTECAVALEKYKKDLTKHLECSEIKTIDQKYKAGFALKFAEVFNVENFVNSDNFNQFFDQCCLFAYGLNNKTGNELDELTSFFLDNNNHGLIPNTEQSNQENLQKSDVKVKSVSPETLDAAETLVRLQIPPNKILISSNLAEESNQPNSNQSSLPHKKRKYDTDTLNTSDAAQEHKKAKIWRPF